MNVSAVDAKIVGSVASSFTETIVPGEGVNVTPDDMVAIDSPLELLINTEKLEVGLL